MASISTALHHPLSENFPAPTIAALHCAPCPFGRRSTLTLRGDCFRVFKLQAGEKRRGAVRVVRSPDCGDSIEASIARSDIPVLSGSEVVQRLTTFLGNSISKQNYLAMYSSIFGGITTDLAAMVIPMDDHMVHRGHGVFDTAAIMDGLWSDESTKENYRGEARTMWRASLNKSLKLAEAKLEARDTMLLGSSVMGCDNGVVHLCSRYPLILPRHASSGLIREEIAEESYGFPKAIKANLETQKVKLEGMRFEPEAGRAESEAQKGETEVLKIAWEAQRGQLENMEAKFEGYLAREEDRWAAKKE
ncbi:hypothetical protein ZIOFF_008337 [Zingiber officinale]|uniref:Uncharacterized protein n=1 Tax=Zingiber officinale TaxID=94328 RepID=A0A8J5IG61_ZINOF|nr:hypothetical protein ZIOFF_008337 [Zingiber officinale]